MRAHQEPGTGAAAVAQFGEERQRRAAPTCLRTCLKAAVSALLRVAAQGVWVPVLVLDDGYRLPLGEPGAGGECLIELARAQPLADLGHQLSLHLPQVRPGRQAHPPAQALRRAFQPRCLLQVAVCERQAGIPGQAQRHELGAAGFFRTSMNNLLAAGEGAGVGHQVILSIVGVDLVPQLVYYRAKTVQEDLLRQGPAPYSIVRATQFFEFMDTLVFETSDDTTVRLPSTPPSWPR